MAFKINTVSTKLESYRPFIVIGCPKVVKTSWVRDLIIKYTGSPEGGLLISCGNEDGYKHLDNLQYEPARVWTKDFGKYEEDLPEELKTRGLVQIIDELVETRGKNGIKIVALDTIDELYQIAWGQIKEDHRKIYGEYPKSLNDAYKGFGQGRKKMIELVNQQIDRLSQAGYAVFLIGHTKTKTKEDIIAGINYDVITNNLEDNFFTALEAKAQMVMNFVLETDFKDVVSETSKGFDGKTVTKEVGTKGTQTRYIYFRDSGLVHACCNFANVPEKVELSVENFLRVFEEGVKAEQNRFGKSYTDTQLKEIQTKEEETNKLTANAFAKQEQEENSETKDELAVEIKAIIKTKTDKKEVIIAEAERLQIKLTDLSNTTLNALKEFKTFVTNL